MWGIVIAGTHRMLFMRFLAPCAAARLLRGEIAVCLRCAVLRCVPVPFSSCSGGKIDDSH